MRSIALLTLLVVGVGCRVAVPGPRGLGVDLNAIVRADVQVSAAVALDGAEVVEFFGIPLDGAQDVVFVLDCSGSMNEAAQGQIATLAPPSGPPTVPPPPQDPNQPHAAGPPPPPPVARKIDIAHHELAEALTRLPAGTRMNIIFFNNTLDAYAASIVTLEDGQRAQVIEFVQASLPMGRTALAPAMRAAFLMNAKRIILLSDGLGNLGGDSGAVLRDAREAMRGEVRIDAVGIGRQQDRRLLYALAAESGGIYQEF